MTVALDASVTMAWCFRDERTPAVVAILRTVVRDVAVVPSIWRLEVANSLRTAVRRGRITAAQRDLFLNRFARLRIRVDAQTDHQVWPAIVTMSDVHNLSVYDASYLELACRSRLPLAALDMRLRSAAQAEKLTVLGV